MVDKITTVTSECIHHWIIEPASGRESKGRCKKCKQVKNFSNSSWDNMKTLWSNNRTEKK